MFVATCLVYALLICKILLYLRQTDHLKKSFSSKVCGCYLPDIKYARYVNEYSVIQCKQRVHSLLG